MAHPRPIDRFLTLEEYAQLPTEDGWRDELSRGRLIREPGPGAAHGRVQVRLGGRLDRFVTEHQLGFVTVESGFVLERNPDTVRGPDVAFVARERYGAELPKRWPEYGPDLVVEVLSPSDRPARIGEKVAQYLGAGTRMVWLIDPGDRMALVYRSATEVTVLREEEELEGGDVLPGFHCVLKDVLD